MKTPIQGNIDLTILSLSSKMENIEKMLTRTAARRSVEKKMK